MSRTTSVAMAFLAVLLVGSALAARSAMPTSPPPDAIPDQQQQLLELKKTDPAQYLELLGSLIRSSPPPDAETDLSGGPDAEGYLWVDSDEPGGPAYSWDSYWSNSTSGDDNVVQYTFGWNFYYRGTNYTSVYISTNGYITFGSAGYNYSSTGSYPNANFNAAEVGAYVSDLYVDGSTGTLRYGTYGSVGSRKVVISWENIRHLAYPGQLMSFQLILNESDKSIVAQYRSNNYGWNYYSGRQGMQNTAKTVGLNILRTQLKDSYAIKYSQPPTSQNWTGAVSTDWNNTGNWSAGWVPTGSMDITIPGGRPNYPTTNAGSAYTTKGLTVQSGATMTVVTSKTLTCNGAFANAGTFTNNGTVACKSNFTNTGDFSSGTGSAFRLSGSSAASVNTGATDASCSFFDVFVEKSPASVEVGNGMIWYPYWYYYHEACIDRNFDITLAGTITQWKAYVYYSGAYTNIKMLVMRAGYNGYEWGTVAASPFHSVIGTQQYTFNDNLPGVQPGDRLCIYDAYPLFTDLYNGLSYYYGGDPGNGANGWYSSYDKLAILATISASPGAVSTYGNLDINGGLTVNSGNTLRNVGTDQDGIYSVAGNWTNNGDFQPGDGEVVYDGTSTISGSGTHDFYDVGISGSLTAPSTMDVAGDWTCGGTFTHNGGLVTLSGSGACDLNGGGSGGAFNNLTVNKPTDGTVSATGDLGVQGLMKVTAGTFELGEHTLTLGSAGASGAVLVDASGVFDAVGGAADALSTVTAVAEAYPYAFGVSGQIGAQYAGFRWMNTSGVNVTGTIDATDNFSHSSFDHGAADGPMLSIANGQTLDDIQDLDFTGSAGYNVGYTSGTGHVTVTGGQGSRWGEDYDNEPGNLVVWAGRDVGCTAILVPGAEVDENTVVYPKVTVENFGIQVEDFNVRVVIDVGTDALYDEVEFVDDLGVGESRDVEFTTGWTATPLGHYVVNAATELTGDVDATNDGQSGEFDVVEPFRHDVGCTAILRPAGTVMLDEVVFPRVTVENFGEVAETFMVEVTIEDATDAVVFQEEEQVVALGIGESRPFDFTTYSWTATPVGDYTVSATTKLVGDDEPLNDAQGPLPFVVTEAPPWPAGWNEVEKVPGTVAVKDGGWLTAAEPETDGLPVIYAAKGNKSTDFYKYYAIEDSWASLAPIDPNEAGRTKPPKKGCVGVSDGVENIYMTKGNNTLGFWKYSIASDSWTRLPDVPVGPNNKKVKGGTDLAYVPGVTDEESSYVYLMKGYKTEFYRFNTESSRWDTLYNVPYGVAPKYNAGSFLVYDGSGYLYAHQSKYTDALKTKHFMFRYDLAGQKWDDTLDGMPVLGMDGGKMKNKKSKDGGSGAWYDGSMYALKGGNTCQFYRYAPAPADSWTELDTMKSFGSTAKKKKVKAGGDLVSFGFGSFFAFKGNKTFEFWRYVGPALQASSLKPQARTGVMANPSTISDLRMTISPNPLSNGFATLRYALPKAGSVTVTVFDVAGRSAFRQSAIGNRSSTIFLDLRKLANGVYLVRLDADGYTHSQKLVVQR